MCAGNSASFCVETIMFARRYTYGQRAGTFLGASHKTGTDIR